MNQRRFRLSTLGRFLEACESWEALTPDEQKYLRYLVDHESLALLTDSHKAFCDLVYDFAPRGSSLEREINQIWNSDL